jgi:hypothetical protein
MHMPIIRKADGGLRLNNFSPTRPANGIPMSAPDHVIAPIHPRVNAL